jgi:hypothetical protein
MWGRGRKRKKGRKEKEKSGERIEKVKTKI